VKAISARTCLGAAVKKPIVMLKYCGLSLASAVCLLLSGCFQDEKVVHVKADGSGTIVETSTVSGAGLGEMKKAQKQMESLAGAGGGAKVSLPGLLDEAKLKADAAKMGEGVSFVSARKVSGKDREGYVATYAFKDINTVRIVDSQGGGDSPAGEKKGDDVTFELKKGATAELVIHPPKMGKPAAAGEAPAKSPEDNAMQEAMMTQMAPMFKDAHMSIVVEVEGKIQATTAQYKEGNKVTLVDMDFNKLLANPANIKVLMGLSDATPEVVKAKIKTIPGITFETGETVSIKFQ
jgi:hypothetical protein